MAFYKSNALRRLISSSFSNNSFKVFLALPFYDSTKQIINSYIGFRPTKEEKQRIEFYEKFLKYVVDLNGLFGHEIKYKIKKLKEKGVKITYSFEGTTNNQYMKFSLINYYLRSDPYIRYHPHRNIVFENIKEYLTSQKCHAKKARCYEEKKNKMIKKMLSKKKKDPLAFMLKAKVYFEQSINQ